MVADEDGDLSTVSSTSFGSDNQTIDFFNFNTVSDELELSIERDNQATQTVNLSGLRDHDWYKVTTTDQADAIGNSIFTDRFVGIGTNDPLDKLHLKGPTFANSALRFQNENLSNPNFWTLGMRYWELIVQSGVSNSPNAEYFTIQRNSEDTLFVINQIGSVGIGTNEPTTKLHIYGYDPDISQDIESSSVANLIEHSFKVDGVEQASLFFSKANDELSLRNMTQGGQLSLHTNGTNRININQGGVVRVSNLAGTNTRMVVADAAGTLSTQAVPSGGDDNLGNHKQLNIDMNSNGIYNAVY